MMLSLNKIAELTDPKAIATEFKKLPRKEAIAIAFQCAINWVDNEPLLFEIMYELKVPQQAMNCFGDSYRSSTSNNEILKNSLVRMESVEGKVWGALEFSMFLARCCDHKRIGAIANLALKQLERK